MFDAITQDLRFSLRALAQRPGFTGTVVLIMAVGIGSSTGIASVASAVLLQPLPYPDGARLVSMFEANPSGGMDQVTTSYQVFLDWKGRAHSFASMAVAYAPRSVVLDAGPDARTLSAALVSPAYFTLTGAQPIAGRVFGDEADRVPAGHAVVVLSEEIWDRRFDRDPDLIGTTILLDSRPYTVVGVLPAGVAAFPNPTQRADLWVPITMGTELLHPNLLEDRMVRMLPVLARLAPGVTAAGAHAELAELSERMAQEHPLNSAGWVSRFQSVRQLYLGTFRGPVIALLVGSGFLLLIGCANVASLLLVRATERHREIGLRIALGATRQRIGRQMLTEALVLTMAAGALGALAAVWGVQLLAQLSPIALPAFLDIGVDGRVLMLALSISLLTGLVFGLVPLAAGWRADLRSTLAGAGKGSGSGGAAGARLRQLLVVGEVAAAVTLLVGAGLTLRSLSALQSHDLGFRPDGLLTLTVEVSAELRADAELAPLVRQLVEQGRRLPGVTGAAIWSPHVPGASGWYTRVRPQDQPTLKDGELPLVRFHHVDGGAFAELGLRLISGRAIASTDRADSRPVVVLSASAAAAMWPDEPAVGKIMRRWNRDAWATVVGVVADARQAGRQGPGGQIPRDVYFSYEQEPQRTFALMLRTAGDPASHVADLRGAVQAAIPDLPVFDIQPLAVRLAEEERTPRFTAALAACYSILATTLAAIGLYSVLAYTVSRRCREIGLRMALGAWPRAIVREVLGQGLALAALGTLLGVAAALAGTRLLGPILYETRADDPVTFVTVPLLLLLVVTFACAVPARRATRVDPMNALRND